MVGRQKLTIVAENRSLDAKHVTHPVIAKRERPVIEKYVRSDAGDIRGRMKRQHGARPVEDIHLNDVDFNSGPRSFVPSNSADNFTGVIEVKVLIMQIAGCTGSLNGTCAVFKDDECGARQNT